MPFVARTMISNLNESPGAMNPSGTSNCVTPGGSVTEKYQMDGAVAERG